MLTRAQFLRLVAGAVLGSDGLAPVKPFFGDLFKGFICQ